MRNRFASGYTTASPNSITAENAVRQRCRSNRTSANVAASIVENVANRLAVNGLL